MRWPTVFSRDVHVGIALSRDRLTASLPVAGGETPWTHALSAPPTVEHAPPDLSDALTALRAALEESLGAPATRRLRPTRPTWHLHVALLPPLSHLRLVELPGVRLAEASQAIRREPTKYMPATYGSAALELEIEGSGWRQTSPFTLLAAPRPLVEEIHAVAARSGWRVAEIVSACSAWATAPSRLGHRGDGARVIVCHDGQVEMLTVHRGALMGIRRLPASVADVASMVAGPHEAETVPVAPPVLLDGQLPATLAARFAARAARAAPVLVAPVERRARQAASAQRSVRRLAAAGVLLVAATAVMLWAMGGEQSRIAERRAALRESVASALATRDTLTQLLDALRALRSSAAGTADWSTLLVSLSDELPLDAALSGLRIAGDTLRLEGSAARAAPVIDAVGRVQVVRSVRADEPIRQNTDATGVRSEHFVLSAALGGRP